MRNNREPFSTKSCFQSILKQSMGLLPLAASHTCSSYSSVFTQRFAHSRPASPHRSVTLTFGGASVASAQARSQEPWRTTRDRKDFREGHWGCERIGPLQSSLSPMFHAFITNSPLQNPEFSGSMLSVVYKWFPKESEQLGSNSVVKRPVTHSYASEKNWSNKNTF